MSCFRKSHALLDAGENPVREWRHAERDRPSLQESLLRCYTPHPLELPPVDTDGTIR